MSERTSKWRPHHELSENMSDKRFKNIFGDEDDDDVRPPPPSPIRIADDNDEDVE